MSNRRSKQSSDSAIGSSARTQLVGDDRGDAVFSDTRQTEPDESHVPCARASITIDVGTIDAVST